MHNLDPVRAYSRLPVEGGRGDRLGGQGEGQTGRTGEGPLIVRTRGSNYSLEAVDSWDPTVGIGGSKGLGIGIGGEALWRNEAETTRSGPTLHI